MNASEHFQAGRLREALAVALGEVKAHPGDAALRGLVCELLCFTGDLERADKQLDTLTHLDPELVPVMAGWRQLLRGETARREFFRAGHVPEFLELPEPEVQLRLQASILIRENDLPGAAALLDQAESLRPRLGGICDEVEFDDIRDLDDLTASFLEVLTTHGKYYWVPFNQIKSLVFHQYVRPLDLLWRKSDLLSRSGQEATVFIPVLYPGTAEAQQEPVQLGRVTEWHGGDGTPVRGVGQRMLLIGECPRPILELTQLDFHEGAPI